MLEQGSSLQCVPAVRSGNSCLPSTAAAVFVGIPGHGQPLCCLFRRFDNAPMPVVVGFPVPDRFFHHLFCHFGNGLVPVTVGFPAPNRLFFFGNHLAHVVEVLVSSRMHVLAQTLQSQFAEKSLLCQLLLNISSKTCCDKHCRSVAKAPGMRLSAALAGQNGGATHPGSLPNLAAHGALGLRGLQGECDVDGCLLW